MIGDFDNIVKMMIDFDRKLSALEILISNNFMLCKYLFSYEVCTGIMDGVMMINISPYE